MPESALTKAGFSCQQTGQDCSAKENDKCVRAATLERQVLSSVLLHLAALFPSGYRIGCFYVIHACVSYTYRVRRT